MVTKPKNIRHATPHETFDTFGDVTSLFSVWRDGLRDTICTADCDDLITQWRGMYPVYSAKSDTIYINELYAYCNDDTDIIHAVPTLECKHVGYKDMGVVVERALKGDFAKDCTITFKFPDNIMNITSKSCTASIINSCLYSEFQFPDNFGMTHAEVVAACEGGFSYYVASKKDEVFNNPFCTLCNGQLHLTTQHCGTLDYFHVIPFTIILQYQALKQTEDATPVPLVCHRNEKVTHYRIDDTSIYTMSFCKATKQTLPCLHKHLSAKLILSVSSAWIKNVHSYIFSIILFSCFDFRQTVESYIAHIGRFSMEMGIAFTPSLLFPLRFTLNYCYILT